MKTIFMNTRCRVLVVLALAVAGSMPSPVRAQDETSAPDVEQRLERGMDVGGQVRALSAESGRDGIAVPVVHAAGPVNPGGRIRRLRGDLERIAEDGAGSLDAGARSGLARRIDAVRAELLLAETLLDEQAERVSRLPGADGARARIEARRGELDIRWTPLRHALEEARRVLSAPGSDSARLQRRLTALRDRLPADTDTRAARILGASPPHHRPRFPQRAPRVEPVIVPSYAAIGAMPQPADQAASDDAPLAPAILAKAAELDYDYARIFDFVRQEIRTEWYAGQMRGPELTLSARAGNDVDQAALLIALLRASGAGARYVHGSVELSLGRLSDLLGPDDAQGISRALTRAGVANEAVVSGGQVSAFRLEHTWVSAHLPYANYRGSILDMSGTAWLPLAPAIKPHGPPAAGPGLDQLIPDPAEFEQTYLDSRAIDGTLAPPAQALLAEAEAQDPDLDPHGVTSRPVIQAGALDILPASLPFAVAAVFAESATLADEFRQQIRIRIWDGVSPGRELILDRQLPAAGLSERRVTLAYQPASSVDQDLILANGGFALTPPSLLRVRPVIHIDGLPLLVADQAMDMAADHDIEITIAGPGGQADYRQVMHSGGLSALYFGTGLEPDNLDLEYQVDTGDSEQRAARLLGGLVRRYAADWTAGEDLIAGLGNVRLQHPLPGLVMANLEMTTETIFGLAAGMDFRGVSLDAGLRPVEAFAAEAAIEQSWYRLAALHGSVLEHRLFENQWAVHGVSADRLLALADSIGLEVLTLDSPGDAASLPYDPPVVDAVEQWLQDGYRVRIPEQSLTVDTWTGTGWVARDPDSGESGFFITGAYAGGATTEAPADWVLDFLADALRYPYDGPPNEDPASATRLRIVPATDNQTVVAGQETELPPTVLVTDRYGRPVKGAEVTLFIQSGGGEFTASGGAEVVVQSDELGIAGAMLQAGDAITQSWLLRLNPEDENATRVENIRVGAVAASGSGAVILGKPFRIIKVPGSPAEIERAWSMSGDVQDYLLPYQGGITYRVLDQHGNPVSNARVSLSAADAPDCPGSETWPTRFAPAGECSPQFLEQEFPGQGLTPGCGQPFVDLITDHQGRVVADLVLTNATYSSTDVQAYVEPGVEDVYEIVSPYGASAPPNVCSDPDGFDLGVGRFTLEARTLGGWPMEAAPPQEMLQRSRTLVIGCYTRGGSILWHQETDPGSCANVESGLAAAVNATGGGQATPLVNIAPKIYQFDLQTGSAPAWHSLSLDVDPNVHGELYATLLSGWIGSYFTVQGEVVLHNTPPVPINDDDRLAEPVVVTREILPLSYRPNQSLTWLQIRGEQRDWSDAYRQDYREAAIPRIAPEDEPPPRTAPAVTTFEAGRYMDPHEEYEVAAVLNPGTPWEIDLTPASLSHGQHIISGFDAHVLNGGPGQILPEVLDRHPRHLSLTHDIDVANQLSCQQGGILRFELNHQANISLTFTHLDDQGQPTTMAWRALEAETFEPGVHVVNISMRRLRFGDFQYEMHATSQVYDDLEETYAGMLSHKPNRRDQRPLAHATVKDVDLFDGSLNISREDVNLAGRGPGLRFVRSYSSHRATRDGVLGFGWTHNYAATLQITECGEYILTGADGQSMRFVSEGTQDGIETFRALRGYNGTLRRFENGSFEFYAKGGTRYVMQPDPVSGYYLSLIEDVNGNTVTLEHTLTDGERLLREVTDDAGRSLIFEHETRQFEIEDRLEISRPVVTAVNGPAELRIEYEYDGHGNLVRATRQVGAAPGRVDEGYGYTDHDQAVTWPGDRPTGSFFFGYRLTEVRDQVNNATRNFDYAFGWDYFHDGETLYSLPRQRVSEVVEPDGGDTGFDYTGDRGVEPVETLITDARGHTTTYQLNQYGAATEISRPIGTERMAWDLDVMRRLWHEDANGLRRDYTYDQYANRTGETITGPGGTQDRSWTYLPPGHFIHPVKNRVDTATDWRGITTDYGYDARGNLTSRSRGGITESFGYNGRGDRTSETDGTGYTRSLSYNDRGNLTRVTDPHGLIMRQTWDALGRKVSMTDGEGFTTDYTLDSRGRKTRVDYPGPDFKTIDYDDAANTRIETNARGIATTYVHDDMSRLLEVRDALGVLEAYAYDPHGNVIRETDGRGHVREHDYDAEDRRERTMAPEGLIIEFDHDDVGNLTRERRGNPDDGWRVTEYEYDHPLYKRTRVRRINPDGEDAVEDFAYDANGNRIERTDPRDHLTTWDYDDRDRVVTETAPEGRVTTYAYDDADRRIRTTLNTSPPQVRHMDYDGRGREIARTDATGEIWRKDYDRRDRVVQETDPRGAVVTHDYDNRGRRIRMAGPLADMVTEYAHDPMGNVVSELHPNGRLIETDYDIRERVTLRTDPLGQIAAFDYDGNDNLVLEQDGEGRITRHFYDDLDHRIRSELPEDRDRHWTRNVFGEATSETNPRDFVTTHSYDALGRRTTTVLPDASEITRTYDPAGNQTSENDARGQVTTWTYDVLNRRTGQTDPSDVGTHQSWTYDAAGNVLTHTDRRGIETRTPYDGENRPLEERRAGVLMARHEYDPAGNEILMVDANGRETEYDYDLAGRKLKQTRPGSTETSWTYTPMGEVLTRTDPDGRVTTNTWDLRQRLETRTNHDGETTEYGYDLAGNRTLKIRPEDGEWNYVYDDADRLVEVTNPENETTTYTWDANGNHTGQTDARGRTTTFDYNELDHLSARIYPDSTGETYTHDAHGNRLSHTDADGQTRTFTYDGLDRRVTASYPDATGSQAETVEYTYDGNGNRTEVTETLAAGGTATTTFQYDAFDRLERETDRYGRTTAHVYDLKGNRIRRIDETGTTIYGIDALDRTESITAPGRGAVQYTYSPAGRVEQIDHPDGTRTEQTYDAAGRVETVEHYNGGAREAYYEYAYDDNGNRTSQIEDLGQGEVETTYTYDDVDRLIETERADRTTEYLLDDVGNRIEERITDPGGTTVKTFDYNDRDQLERIYVDGALETEYTYDANGNRIQVTTGGIIRHFNFSARDRLVSLNVQGSPPEVQWEYDDAGFRISETTPSEARRFRWDNNTLSYETNVLGNLLARYDHGPDRLLAETQGSTTRTWLTDALSTPVKRLNEDGSVYSFTRYDEYGEVAEENSPDIPRFGFTGHQRGPAEAPDLYYAQQRWYNAATGRFISEDPVWGEPDTPPSLHRYLYAYANPTVYWDPDGRSPATENYIRSFWPEDKRNRFEELERQRQRAQADVVTGATQAVGDSVVGLGFFAATTVNASLETLSGGMLDFGAREKFDQMAAGTAEFLKNPIQNTSNYVNQRRNEIRRLEEAGMQEAADRLKGRFAFEMTSAIAGGYGAARGATSFLSRQGRNGSNASVSVNMEAPDHPGSASHALEHDIGPNSGLSRGTELRAKYGHLTPEQRAARMGELSMGNRVLRDAGVPRQYISEALQSFEPGTITHRIAGQNDFGLRLYGGASGPKSPYVGPTFPLGDVRSLNAVIPENTLDNIIQWQIRPGTPLLEGRIRANFGQPGGARQIFVPEFHDNLLTPGRL